MRRPGVRIPLPPVFARVVDESEDCRAAALAERTLFTLPLQRSELRLGKPTRYANFFYVYILQSEVAPERFYTGLTDDLRKRVKNHNSGQVLHTMKWRPWRLKTYIAFSDRARAAQFERYLKSAAGRAFTKKHL